MLKKLKYLLFICVFFNCKPEARTTGAAKVMLDEFSNFKNADFSDSQKYKVTHVNDGFGKRLYIDSLNFNVFRIYYVNDSNKIQIETYEDFINDTISRKTHYSNGKIKEVNKTTYHRNIPIGIWKYYKINGELDSAHNYEEGYKVTFDSAMTIAKKYGIQKPFDTGLCSDFKFWRILNWKIVQFDSSSNRQIDIAKGIKVDILNGDVERVTDERTIVY